MRTSIDKIKDIIFDEGQASAKYLRDVLGVSQVLVHRHLKTLCAKGDIKKIGVPPKVFYLPVLNSSIDNEVNNKIFDNAKVCVGGVLDNVNSVYNCNSYENISVMAGDKFCVAENKSVYSSIVEDYWLEILPHGRFLYGLKGFEHWCKKRKMNVREQAQLFEKIFWEKDALKINSLIDASAKIVSSFEKSFLEKIWYLDFYSWEIFGKTLLGKLVLYAKQNSDLLLMKKISDIVRMPLLSLINRECFDLIVLIPHSISRKRDFLQTTISFLNLNPSAVRVFDKVFVEHVVAQKTLKSKVDRQKNAEETLFLKVKNFPKKILLIDDACGSGSTLNIAAKKILKVSPQTKIYAFTFVGSMKGFEVINEM